MPPVTSGAQGRQQREFQGRRCAGPGGASTLDGSGVPDLRSHFARAASALAASPTQRRRDVATKGAQASRVCATTCPTRTRLRIARAGTSGEERSRPTEPAAANAQKCRANASRSGRTNWHCPTVTGEHRKLTGQPQTLSFARHVAPLRRNMPERTDDTNWLVAGLVANIFRWMFSNIQQCQLLQAPTSGALLLAAKAPAGCAYSTA